MAKIFCMLCRSWKSIWLPFYLWRVLKTNGVDGQLLHSMVPRGVSWLSKWQAIKAFHIGIELWQEYDLFLLFFIVCLNWIDKCNHADELASIGNSKIGCPLCADDLILLLPEVDSSRTSLRTHFEVLGLEGQVLGLGLEGQVLGLGLEASSPRKLACPRLEDSTIFLIVKILWSAWKIFWKTFFCGDRLKNFCEDLFFSFFFGDRLKNFCEDLFFLFWRALVLVSLALASSIPVLSLESVCPRKGCPWPWPRIFFVSLALASSLVSSTPPLASTESGFQCTRRRFAAAYDTAGIKLSTVKTDMFYVSRNTNQRLL